MVLNFAKTDISLGKKVEVHEMHNNVKFKYSFNSAWQIEPVNDFVYVLNYATKNFLNLHGVSKDIWLLIGEGKSLSNIVATISSKYHVEYAVVYKDTYELINVLLNERVIEYE